MKDKAAIFCGVLWHNNQHTSRFVDLFCNCVSWFQDGERGVQNTAPV